MEEDKERATQTKSYALEKAIVANAGLEYDEEGRAICDPDLILKAAQKFEAYLKG